MDVNETYSDNYFIICVSQVIVLYNLNLYSARHQFYLNKTKKKKKRQSWRLGHLQLCSITLAKHVRISC